MIPFGLQMAVSMLSKGSAKGIPGMGGAKRKRSGRRGLTQKRKNDLLWLKNNVGKTAAGNYLSNHSL